MRNFRALFLLATIPLYLAADADGCASPQQQASETQAVKRQQAVFEQVQPIPSFDFSLERQRMIDLYKARQSAAQTWSVWRAYDHTIDGWCPSSGFPIPYGTELTAPDRVWADTHGTDGYAAVTVSNPEPNGLYTQGSGSPGTWVFCIIDTEIAPIYVEDNVTVYPFPVSVDEKTGHVERIGAPTVKLTK
jgi:hypothetical protein